MKRQHGQNIFPALSPSLVEWCRGHHASVVICVHRATRNGDFLGRTPANVQSFVACLQAHALKNEMKIVRCQTNIPSLPDTSAEVSIYEGYLLFTRRLE